MIEWQSYPANQFAGVTITDQPTREICQGLFILVDCYGVAAKNKIIRVERNSLGERFK